MNNSRTAPNEEQIKAVQSECVQRPLCVDLDGTLIASDVLWESLLILARTTPWALGLLPLWLMKGRAFFKQELAKQVALNPSRLPYRPEVVRFVREGKESGREVILVTGSDQQVANKIADYLNVFSGALGSDGRINLIGHAKLTALQKRIGSNEFDYVGNSKADIPLWRVTRGAILVNPSRRLLNLVSGVCTVSRVFQARTSVCSIILNTLRVYQWTKNILLLVPLLTSHKILEGQAVINAVIAVAAFSLCASGIYILNDLLDLEFDRGHARKKFRPFAAGELQIKTGLFLSLCLIFSSIAIGRTWLSPRFVVTLLAYFLVTVSYSLHFKRVLIADVLVLAGLYCLRVLAGAVAINVSMSPWLLAFSMFFFLSLAFIKRFSELSNIYDSPSPTVSEGRGYLIADKELLRSIGVASGYVSILVLALYINSVEVTTLYRDPEKLWIICPLFLYWITRLWLLAHRGMLHDDPVIYTLKDRVSYVIGAATGLAILTSM